jgi:tRNA threonylcarbamoyladenosine biosynthesis protein TsaB
MKIISIETSSHICGVSLLSDGVIIDKVEVNHPKVHAEKLPVQLNEIISRNNLDLDSIDGVAISAGPGSYTGLRIGMSLVKGFALATNLPIIPVQSLLGIEYQVKDKSEHWICIFSHRDYVFAQKYKKGLPINEPKCIKIELMKNGNIFGYGIPIDMQPKFYYETIPSSEFIGKLADENFVKWSTKDHQLVTPLYLTEFNIATK